MASLFHILALGRTLANSVETALTTLALCFWPWHISEGIKQVDATSITIQPTLTPFQRDTTFAHSCGYYMHDTAYKCDRMVISMH